MSGLAAVLKRLPSTAYLYGLLAVAVVSGFAGFVHYQRVIGARNLALHQADSVAKVRQAEFKEVEAEAAEARRARDVLLAKARAEVAKDRAAKVLSDSMISAASTERDRAQRLLSDSLATVAQLREQVTRLVASGKADSAAQGARIAQLERTKASLLLLVGADSTAIQKGIAATNAAVARAVAAETQVKILRRLLPSTAGQWVKTLLTAGAAFEAGRASAGQFP
jgi:hypothetical protein